jgi:hypothetical protein
VRECILLPVDDNDARGLTHDGTVITGDPWKTAYLQHVTHVECSFAHSHVDPIMVALELWLGSRSDAPI